MWLAMLSNAAGRLCVLKKSLSSSMIQLHRLRDLTTPEKIPRKRGRIKGNAEAELGAVLVGMFLGGALGALQIQEAMPTWSQVPESLSVIASVVATLLVVAAFTQRMRSGLLCGAIAAISQFLTVLAFYSYTNTIGVAMAVVPYQSLGVLAYPAAGVIGGYVGSHIREARSVAPTRRLRHTRR
jgi:pheromone shutdown protein TraB